MVDGGAVGDEGLKVSGRGALDDGEAFPSFVIGYGLYGGHRSEVYATCQHGYASVTG